jgi:hypothetical protein
MLLVWGWRCSKKNASDDAKLRARKSFLPTSQKEKNSKTQYVAGEGLTKEGNTIAFRVQVSVTNTTTEMRIDFGGAGGQFLAESCTGVNCSKCRFAKTGGCECERTVRGADGHCNHNISK